MFGFFSRFVGRLPVGRKLMLIYLLDLTAVIYISGILIHEKVQTIDFTRKEIVGNAYLGEIQRILAGLPSLADAGAPQGQPASTHIPALVQRLQEAEHRHGPDLQSGELSQRMAHSLQGLHRNGSTLPQGLDEVIGNARNLITRIGNQSNLILDPDLDTYYTMSLTVLRFIEVQDLLDQMSTKTLLLRAASSPDASALATDLLVLQGRMDAALKSIESDYSEAIAATTPQSRAVLEASRDALSAQLNNYLELLQHSGPAGQALSSAAVLSVHRQTLQQLHQTWQVNIRELDILLQARVAYQIQRMALHMGTALALLALILALVYFVARQISQPMKALARVADDVSRTSDYTRRAHHDSPDEIGHLVTAFNTMLADLDRQRGISEELAATERAQEAQKALLASFPSPLIVTSIPEHRILHANQPAREWLGVVGDDPWQVCLDSGTRARYFQILADLDSVDSFEVHWQTGVDARGMPLRQWALLSGRRLNYQGQPSLLTVFTPIEQIKLLEQRLQLWAKVFEASSENILILDVNRRLLIANRSFTKAGGWDLAEITDCEPDFFYSDHHDVAFYDTLWQSTIIRGSWQGEVWFRRKNGESYPTWLVANVVRDAGGSLTHLIVSASDMTDHKKNEARIHHLAHHDVLTDLPNRSLCMERLRMAIEQADRQGMLVGVVFMDLDRFKNINDSLGHHVGDALLRSVANRLQLAVRAGDTVCRLGGDEFVIVLAAAKNQEEIMSVVSERIVPRIREPHVVDGTALHVSCSAGIAVYPQDGQDVDVLMRNADAAMYQAKAGGRDNAVFFRAEFLAEAQDRLELEKDLRTAIAAGELELFYQPRIHAGSATVCGVEALIRWKHPQHGYIPPARFIPAAEESSLINELGAWVIQEAFRQHRVWREGPVGFLPVSINVSVKQLHDASLATTLQQALVTHAIEAQAIELELTETFLMENAATTIETLRKLKALGISLSIDDFGTGYSSLNYLNQFPIDKLKIDQSFVRDMMTDPADLAIARAIIGLGHILGLTVVAEGVEEAGQANELKNSGCDELQGYLYSKPLPAAELEAWIRNYRA